jgi:hypothetical protein
VVAVYGVLFMWIGVIWVLKGCLVGWDRRVVEKIECVWAFSECCSFRNVDDNFEWAFAAGYGPIVDSDRRVLWDELTGLISWWNSPCIGGDFNIIHFLSERSSGARLSLVISEFFEFIFEQGLMDIPLIGGVITHGLIIEIL